MIIILYLFIYLSVINANIINIVNIVNRKIFILNRLYNISNIKVIK